MKRRLKNNGSRRFFAYEKEAYNKRRIPLFHPCKKEKMEKSRF
jgi:hypothetical protein